MKTYGEEELYLHEFWMEVNGQLHTLVGLISKDKDHGTHRTGG
jgi:hypothetical protein